MKYPYYSPNITLGVFLKSLLTSTTNAENRIKKYFSALTNKKYILITNSCRTALFLAYKALEKQGEVLTSPLTCKVAIDPIIESNNEPVYADVKKDDLTLNQDDIEHRITERTIAIQAIHLGGVSCEMDKILHIARQHQLYVIEDCAQSLGSKFKGENTGTFGDVACFSLIKNAYGIGGGVFATNNAELFERAKAIHDCFPNSSKLLTVYRILKNLIDTYKSTYIGGFFYRVFYFFKGSQNRSSIIKKQLLKISNISLKITSYQMSRFNKLHSLRKKLGSYYFERMTEKDVLINNRYNAKSCSFTKFFVFHPRIDSKKIIERMHKKNIECMHLEHKTGSPYQKMIITKERAKKEMLYNYIMVHDSILSLPLVESFKLEQIEDVIFNLIKEININEENSF